MSTREPPITDVLPGQFADFVQQNPGLTLIDFWAPWCGPCKAIAPVLERLASELPDQLRIGKVNVDEANELAAQFGVRSIPTLVLFRHGQPVAQKVGVQSADALRAWVQQHA